MCLSFLTQYSIPVQPFRISGFDPPPARVFAWRVLELKEQGVSEDDAMSVADVIPSLRLPFVLFIKNPNRKTVYYVQLFTFEHC
jgi:hypothetical protein